MAEETDDKPELVKVRRKDLLSTGSTLLNLSCSGNPHGGFLKGKYYLLVGDSASGKTFFSMTCLAEASINKNFHGYRFIYDNGEDGCLLNLDNLFSEQVADRIEPPETDKDGDPIYSDTIETFYFHLDDAIQKAKPFVYILDSMDSLDTDSAEKKFQQHKKAFVRKRRREAGEELEKKEEDKVSGSYGDGKAKKNSEFLRKAMKHLRELGSILIVVSQTRDDPSAMFANAKTRAGGRALRFYATNEIWTSIACQINKDVLGKKRSIGTRIRLQGKKNRVTGKLSTVEVDIYPDSGIDDIGSCIDFLTDEGFWPMEKQTITATGLNISGTRDKVIRLIEKRNLEDKVREACGECWQKIDEAMAVRRKNRYAIQEGNLE